MRLSDFYMGWAGDGFGGLCDHEAHFEEAPPCDYVDDVCQAFAERTRPMVVLLPATAAPSACAICGADLGFGATSSTCSRSCAHALGKSTERLTPGVVLGSLTALRQVKSKNGHAWEFRCSCGSVVVRVLTALRQSVRRGFKPSCPACSAASRGVGSLTSAELLEAADRNHRAWSRRARKAA